MHHFLLMAIIWMALTLVTLPVTVWRFGRPYPLWRGLHIFWMWPLVLFVLLCDFIQAAWDKRHA